MKTTTAKTYLTGAGVVATAFFFWLFLYQIFVSSQAATSSASILFDRSFITAKSNDNIQVNVLFQTAVENHIDNAQISIAYNPELLTFVNTPTSKIIDLTPAETTCTHNNYKLKHISSITDDPNRGILTMNRTSTDQTSASGMFCYGTLTFRLKRDITSEQSGLSFIDADKWNVSGTKGPITVKPADYNTSVILVQ